MADGFIAQAQQQTPSYWEAASNASFEAMWEQFWAKLAHKHRLPQPPNAGKQSRLPTARQPARAIHPGQPTTGTKKQVTYLQQATASERHAHPLLPMGALASKETSATPPRGGKAGEAGPSRLAALVP
ncbi:Hypothetical predicted protein [Pelobates cultripes]|uniref:Uncharacterized protein n=1 Tax=Pelobates cultripes TaxID=61616 RepID=A0AAD1TM27_PELCU|nr:Hypothetical predicted protein [Pelobates cultripes]